MKSDFDAVIVGSGAGGSAMAWGLTQLGAQVLVLEAGPEFSPVDYRLAQADWELRRFPHKPGSVGKYSYGPMQDLEPRWKSLRSWNHILGRFNPTDKRLVFGYHHVRGVGGTTLHFTGEKHRLNPLSMRMHSRFGVAADWPLDYLELEPFYSQAEQVVGVTGPATSANSPRSAPYPLPPHEMSYASRKLGEGFKKLKMKWVLNSLAALSRPYHDRPPCNYCGNCNRGCPIADKGSADVTFLRQARATMRCLVMPDCLVVRLVAGRNDRVDGLDYIDGKGGLHTLDLNQKILVLAGGAVETPRLLLASKNAYAPEGLSNESGQVGKNFMETISWVSSGIHPEPMGSHRGLPSDSICWDFNAPESTPGVIGGCRFSPGTAEADLVGPVNYATRVIPGWGRKHKQDMRNRFGSVLSLGAIGESLPNPKSYVDLSSTKDRFNVPLARIHSYLDDMEVKRLASMADKVRTLLKATGIERIFEEYGSYDFFSSTHVFGTCRMGKKPEDSVVDPYGRSHRWTNLYIADASVFPSSGGGEAPSLTIEALAIRTAKAIKGKR